MEEKIDYEREISEMVSKINSEEAKRFLYLFVKDVYNDERGRSSNRKKGNWGSIQYFTNWWTVH